MSAPTADEIARWAALAEAATPGRWELVECFDEDGRPDHWVKFTVGDSTLMDRLADAEFIAAAREAVPRLLALVAAQAEQNAELRGDCDRMAMIVETNRHIRKRAEAELSALRATDEYQRWARAVVERDAAREVVARVWALLDEAENRMEPPYWPRALRAALEGGPAT